MRLPKTVKNVEVLRAHPTLKRLGVGLKVDAAPPTVEEFWRDHDSRPAPAPR